MTHQFWLGVYVWFALVGHLVLLTPSGQGLDTYT
jgi:hypothetical protein